MEEEITIRMEEKDSRSERVLRPIIFTSWFLGVGVARPRKCPKAVTVILRILHFGICSVIVAYGAIDFFTFGSVFKSDIFKIMYYMNKVVCYVASYYYVVHGIRHYDEWPKLVEKMDRLDRMIRKEVSTKDGSVKNGQILAIVATFLLGPMSLIVHALYYYFTVPDDIFASDLLLYYTIAQTLANSFAFDIIVYAICRRFAAINESIEGLNEIRGNAWVAAKLRRIRELHNGACDLVTTANDIYGVHLLLSSANSFTMVVAKLFRIYMSVVEKNYDFILINNVIWLIYAGQFAVTCWVCTLTHRQSDRIGATVQRIVLGGKTARKWNRSTLHGIGPSHRESVRADPSDGEGRIDERLDPNYSHGLEDLLRRNLEGDRVRNEANDFFLQLQQNRVAFTACDFFETNNSLLTGFIGVITTYLIILVQFYRPESTKIGTEE